MTDKKKGAIPFESAPQGETTAADSTAPAPERGIYNPLTWRSEKSVKFRVGWLVLLAVVLIVGWMR